MSDCPIDYKPFSYRRYVDGTGFLFSYKLHVTKFLNEMSFQHWTIKFTVEHEENSLAFFDTKFFRDNGKFQTSVYRKPTFSGVLTNFESFYPYCTNMILILLCYIVFLSSALLIELCILKLKELVRSSGYLQNFVCCIKMHLDKVFIKHPNICLVLKKELVCVFSTKSNQKLKSDCKMLLEEFYHIAD